MKTWPSLGSHYSAYHKGCPLVFKNSCLSHVQNTFISSQYLQKSQPMIAARRNRAASSTLWKSPQLHVQVHLLQILLPIWLQDTIQLSFLSLCNKDSCAFRFLMIRSSFPFQPSPAEFLTSIFLTAYPQSFKCSLKITQGFVLFCFTMHFTSF